ncbi:MAG: DHH family phosphoesterase [Deltaproteobacteria bacterium]|nr:DHH family phosphoesterase [Deltaproteobacteria bacterium]
MPISTSERLRRFFSVFDHSDHVLIMINADPDAIASAMAVKRLLWRKVAGVTITHINVIQRPDNLAMIRLLGIGLVYIEEINVTQFNRFVIVDSQPDHHECFSMVKPDVIIDHHPETCAVASYCDIRPDYGATATIMTEYLRAAKIKPSVKIATGLFHAIKTDTGNFERQTIIEDIRAFQFLYRHANIHLAQRIEHGEIKYGFLKYFDQALHNRKMRKGRIFVHLGNVVNPDVCVLIADFFMRVDKATWSIVSGNYDKKLVVIFRYNGLQKHAGNIAKKAFGSIGSAGGHRSMARAEISVSEIKEMVEVKDDKAVQQWVINRIEKGDDKKRKVQ